MIRIYIIAALLATLAVLGWQWRSEIKINTHLIAENQSLRTQIDAAVTVNEALMDRLDEMVDEHNVLQRQIRESEQRKLLVDRENQRLRHEIEDGLRAAPEWASTPIPGTVAAGVRAAVDRLFTY